MTTMILDHMVTWAEQQPEIRAVLLAGSRARIDPPPDDWADYDVECFTTAVPVDIESRGWAEAFGKIWFYFPTYFEDGTPHPLIVYAGGVKVDVSFDTLAALEKLVAEKRLYDSHQRGYRVLVDKDGLAARLPAPTVAVFTPPTEAEFRRTFDAFWFSAVYVAYQIRRRNLWVAKFRDGDLKARLLKMLEWQARSTWHDGHFLTRWADPTAVQALSDVFGRFDAADSWRSLQASAGLFTRVAREVATQYGFSFPDALDGELNAYLNQLYAADGQGS